MWKYYALLSAFFASLTAIFAKLGVRDLDSDLATGIRVFFILILVWSIAFYKGSIRFLPSVSGASWLWLFLSAMATGLSWLFYFKALEYGDVSLVAPLDKLSVPLTILLAFLLLGEPLTLKLCVGALCITAGAIILVL